ncbi:MAG: hypothetical protein MN733_07035 [Nitrososphaera sp.]|nr:hypothetical protein [Nitrososphaera sp.]
MKGDPIADSEHISRYCGGSQVNEDGTINGVAFRVRLGDEFLSVNWLEFLHLSNRDAEIQEIRRVLNSKLHFGAAARIALLNVRELLQYVSTESPDRRNLQVRHEPEPDDPSHSGIFNLATDDDLIADLIAQVVQETYPARVEPA